MPTLVRAQFSDSDQWSAAIADWNLQFNQLDCGPLEATVDRVMSSSAVVQRVQLSRRFHQCGFAPKDVLTFGVPDRPDMLSWYGKSVQHRSMMSFNNRNGFDAVSEAGFAATTISLNSGAFLQEAAALGAPDLADDITDVAEQFFVSETDLGRIRVVVAGLIEVLGREKSAPKAVASLQRDLTYLLVQSVGKPYELTDRTGYARRQRAVSRALELIVTMPNTVDLSSVVEQSGVSYRTLNRAFKERFGVSPRQYIVATRLIGVRRSLTTSRPGIRVSDVASDWGFWHFGRFASDYKRMFAELPSETLSKYAARCKKVPNEACRRRHN